MRLFAVPVVDYKGYRGMMQYDPNSAAEGGFGRRSMRREVDVLSWLFIIYLGTFIYEGVLRYVFALASVPNLIYFRDALAAVAVFYIFAARLYRERWIDGPVATVLLLLSIHLVIGWMSGASIFQGLFGAKIFLPLLFGVAIWPTITRRPNLFVGAAWVVFVSSVAGVYLNYAYGILPWEAFEYETVFGRMATTREWWMDGGIRRLPGFARTSVHAAGVIGLVGSVLMALLGKTLVRVIVAVTGMWAIILTTSKSMALIFGIISVWLLFPRLWRSLFVGRVFIASIVIVSIILPMVSILRHFGASDGLPSILISFWERLHYMWPGAFSLIMSPLNAVTGNGLGAIGAAQQYGYSPELQNWADNVFLYFYVTFGVFGYAYLLFLAISVFRLSNGPDRSAYLYVAGLVAFFGYGLTSNMAEQAFVMGLLGVSYGAATVIYKRKSPPG